MTMSSEEAAQYYMMKGMLTALTPAQQATYADLHARITAIVKEDVKLGVIAAAMVGMEMDAELDQ